MVCLSYRFHDLISFKFLLLLADTDPEMPHSLSKACFTAVDWGLSPSVNAAILDMASKGLIKRISILAGSPFVKQGLDELKQIPGLEFGLHFNLTLFPPLFEEQQDAFSPFMDQESFHYKPLWKLRWVWLNPFNRKNKMICAKDAFNGQLEKLKTLKIPVSYFDGHQSVHLLPGLLKTLEPEILKWGLKEIIIPSPLKLLVSYRFRMAYLAFRARITSRKLGLFSQPSWRPSARSLSSFRKVNRKIKKNNSLHILVRPAISNDLENYGIRDKYRTGRVDEYQALERLYQAAS